MFTKTEKKLKISKLSAEKMRLASRENDQLLVRKICKMEYKVEIVSSGVYCQKQPYFHGIKVGASHVFLFFRLKSVFSISNLMKSHIK